MDAVQTGTPAEEPDSRNLIIAAAVQEVIRKLFVVDTNVLLHDPSALFRFAEHDIFIPTKVLEELDHLKKGTSDVARSARQVSRFLLELVQHGKSCKSTEESGIPLYGLPQTAHINGRCRGRLFFQTDDMEVTLPKRFEGKVADNSILAVTLWLVEHEKRPVVLVTKDTFFHIKASTIEGLEVEDYHNDRVLDDIDLLYPGTAALPVGFWETYGEGVESWQDKGRAFYKITCPLVEQWHPGQFLYMPESQGKNAYAVVSIEGDTAIIRTVYEHYCEQHAVWGIRARNMEQNFALDALLDPEKDLVTLDGDPGTGKTLLTLAAGLHLTLDLKRYEEIIMTRETVPLGEEIGFLPGTEEEKMMPWMGALLDNLELLGARENGNAWERGATQQLLQNRVKVRSLNFMRGRSFLNRYVIFDESQNLTLKQVRALLTRAGQGTKIVCLGNLAQVDTPYLTGVASGLANIVEAFKNWPYAAHVTLRRGERSRLADFATEKL